MLAIVASVARQMQILDSRTSSLKWSVLFSVASVVSEDSLLKLLCKHRLLICDYDKRASNRKADVFFFFYL